MSLDSLFASNSIYLSQANINIHYLESGTDNPKEEAILLLHGWPTSSFLYRKMMKPLAKHHRVVAIDLPGFGKSDKNPKDSYSFPYHAKIIQALVDELGIKKVHLVVHDLGGPIGMWWAQKNPEQIASYVLLNTLVFPKFSWAVKLFVLMSLLPLVRNWLGSPAGIKFAMRLGIDHKSILTKEVMDGYQDPYRNTGNDKAARECLLKSASKLHMKGFVTIEESLAKISQPTCLLYAENDRILPNVDKTMRQVQESIPHAILNSIPDCGHFLQEEKPDEIMEILDEFYTNMNS